MERDRIYLDENTHLTPLKGQNGENEVEFQKGALKRIVAKDFMTYTHAVLHCTPKLNVIIGPNGTGKSSIVCALCLALGGRNELLARQAQTRSFVRRGATKGYAEVTISGGSGRDYTVRRGISAENDSSTWTINGSSATMESVKKLMKKLNIQLDNLLQFMPQDRVSEFSNLNPTSLLLETERAIGDADLLDKHKKLIELSHSTATARNARDSVRERLTHVESELEDMEMDVQRVLQRDELLREVETIKAKLVWAEAWDRKAKLQEATQKLLEGKDKQARSEKMLRKYSAPSRGLQEEVGQLRRTSNTLQEHLQKLTVTLEANESVLSGFDENMASRDVEIESIASESHKHREEIHNLESAMSDLEQQLAEYPTVPQHLVQRAQQLQKEKIDIRSKVRSEEQKHDAAVANREKKARLKMQCEDYLKRIEQETAQRVLAVEKRREKFQGLHAAYEWVKSNKSLFKDEVYGPLIAEVKASDPYHATALEQVISIASWSCFVTKNMHDKNLLRKVLPEKGIMKEVNVITIENISSQQLHRPGMPRSLPDFGILHTLDEVIDAPQLVKHALNIHHDISELYIGSKETEEKAQELLAAHPEIRKLVTPESVYVITSSRYGNVKAVQSSSLRPPQLFRTGGRSSEYTIERTRIDALDKDIRALTEDINQQEAYIQAYKQQAEDINVESKLIMEEANNIKQGKTRLQKDIALKKRILEMKKRARDPMHKKELLLKEKNDAKDDAVNKVKGTKKVLKEMCKYHQMYAAARLAATERELLISMNSNLVTRIQQTLARDKSIVEQLQQIVDQDKNRLDYATQRAQSQYSMTASLRRKFNKYPDGTEELEQLSHEKECEAAGINCNNSQALEDYRNRKKYASSLHNSLEREDQRLSTLDEQSKAVKDSWLPELKETIAKINNTFTSNFRLIGSVGEVELVGESIHDTKYENYSLEIRVKFRESEPLRALDSSTQSGGERSVSTMLYLISLQSVTHTPFRVVDEINQGMDAVNERKIFDILVSSARNPATPQCFLLTPKLLPDMEYPDEENGKITIQSIFNGMKVPPSNQKQDWESFLGGRFKKRKM